MRLVIARCEVDYAGRLSAHLPLATRLIMIKADGSVLVHSDGGSYKPLNWMSAPCTLTVAPPDNDSDGVAEVWTVQHNKSDDRLLVRIHEILHDSTHTLGEDPGLVKDGVEAHLQELLASNVETFGAGWQLVRREYPTPIGPVDLLCREVVAELVSDHHSGSADTSAPGKRPRHLAIEVKRRATIEAVDQLTRYLELLNRDPSLAPVTGVLAAQSIVPQAKTLAVDRGIRCVVVDYDELRGLPSREIRLF